MADEKAGNGLPTFSNADQKKARQWFAMGEDKRSKRDYDYAIECYITGLNFWTEAVDEGHAPLWSLAVQRKQAGGKKAGMIESMKRSTSGKDVRKAMLNAEWLAARDPQNTTFLEALLKNAVKGKYFQTVRFFAPKVLDELKREKKPSVGRFKALRDVLAEAGDAAEAAGQAAEATLFYETALNALDFLIARRLGDVESHKDELRDISGRLTIVKGKYGEGENFRESIRDADAQKLLHDRERVKQGDQTLDALITAAKQEYEADPSAAKLNAYVDVLVRREQEEEENLAIEALTEAFEREDNYSFKSRADDIRIRQLKRRTRQARAAFDEEGDKASAAAAQEAAREQIRFEVRTYTERVKKYPTDLRLKYTLGGILFKANKYDDAIPLLQAAQSDPRSRRQALLLIGRSFFKKEAFAQARSVLSDAYEQLETKDDLHGKEVLYWLARSHEGAGETDQARDAYSRLVRMEYNYADGDARRRLEALEKA